jgi:tripartite-type tricarboxylate transporter receptor subunit TctC
VLSGEAHLTFATLPGMMPHVKAGRVIPVAVTTAKRSPALPDVPTVAKAGGLNVFAVSSWAGVVAPARTPAPVVDRLHKELVKVLTSPEMRERLARDGAEPVANTPGEFAAFIASELAMWAIAVKQAGAQLD